jgi:hypothetical protein
MPTGIETVIQGLLGQQAMGQRGQEIAESIAARKAQMEEQMRWRDFLQQHSPAWGRLQLAQQAQEDKFARNRGWTKYLMESDINTYPANWRPKILELRNHITQHPEDNVSAIAQNYVTAAKPVGLQLKATQTMLPDGTPVTEYTVFEPTTGTMSVVNPGPGVGTIPSSGGAATPSPAATSSGVSPSAPAGAAPAAPGSPPPSSSSAPASEADRMMERVRTKYGLTK